jgi:GDP-mannose 6-dehydrogenase
MRVAVLGLGYVGTVTAATLASHGHEVCGVDIDASKVAMLTVGRSPIVERGLDDLVSEAVANGSLRATTDVGEALTGAELSLVCVGTPSLPQGGTSGRSSGWSPPSPSRSGRGLASPLASIPS